jgi:hypothetical protein
VANHAFIVDRRVAVHAQRGEVVRLVGSTAEGWYDMVGVKFGLAV